MTLSPPPIIRDLMAVAPIALVLAGLLVGPGTSATDIALPILVGCGSVLLLLVSGAAWEGERS
jgi:hypothetical protein